MRHTILLADDDPGVRRMLCRLLAQEDYLVLAASDGVEALEIWRAAPIELVLLDSNLRIKPGWETLERVRSQNAHVPVIIMISEHKIAPGPEAGVRAVMEKPLDLAKLLELIRELLKQPVEREAGTRGS